MNFQTFKNWITVQNSLHKFAESISDGSTVYFSDSFAACYDLRIRGFEKPDHTIVVQLNVESEQEINESFLEISIETWTDSNYEIWYLDNKLQWLIIADKNGRNKYEKDDLIKSKRINFEFKLNQIL